MVKETASGGLSHLFVLERLDALGAWRLDICEHFASRIKSIATLGSVVNE